MKLYNEILGKSKTVDNKFEKLSGNGLNEIKINFIVPKQHPRHEEVMSYQYSTLSIERISDLDIYLKSRNRLFIVDKSVSEQGFVKSFFEKEKIKPLILKSIEGKVKTKNFLDRLIADNMLLDKRDLLLVIIGGGLLINVGAYLAERISAKLVLFPTTVLAMADSAGGKVRVNFITNKRAYKHFYKSYYEPNAMYLDDRFLDSLPEKQVKIGLSEIIKHALFQSPKLYEFLSDTGKEMFTQKEKLKKAILWSVYLKKICLDIDVEENENGSRRILRGGHDFSDRLEEDMRLQIPHGIAVVIGIVSQLEYENNTKLLEKAEKIFTLFDIPYTIGEFKSWNTK